MERKKYRAGEWEALCFRSLPERAQEIWFQFCEMAVRKGNYMDLAYPYIADFDYTDCKSPIEVIFNFTYDLVKFANGYLDFCLIPQYEVNTENKKYYVDFAFFAEDTEEIIEIKNPNYKLVIECDGHEFHEKTKEQVAKDNEREYELKMLGFDVLRFSGSQIYNKPFRCAVNTLEYINKKVNEVANDGC